MSRLIAYVVFGSCLCSISLSVQQAGVTGFVELAKNDTLGMVYSLASNSDGTVFAVSRLGTWRIDTDRQTLHHLGFIPRPDYPVFEVKNGVPEILVVYNKEAYEEYLRQSKWFRIHSDFTLTRVATLTIDSHDRIFLSEMFGGLHRSTDNGETWEAMTTDFLIETFASPTTLSFGENDLLYLGTAASTLFTSHDGKPPWQPASYPYKKEGEQLTHLFAYQPWSGFILSVLPLEENIFVGTWNQGVLASTGIDTSVSWDWRNKGIETTEVRALAATRASIFAATTNGVFRSQDLGNSWHKLTEGIHGAFARTVFSRQDGLVCVATELGVFYSTNDGKRWQQTGGDFQGKTITALTFDTEGYLYVGTLEGNIYRSTTALKGAEVVASDIPAEFNLLQNYPNPFNASTIIEFWIARDEQVTLTVFDILGREVASLVSEFKRAGVYKTTWNSTGVASGTYLYHIRAGNYVQTRKMVLVK